MTLKGCKHILLLTTFLLGYVSLSFELIVLRQLVNFLGSNTLITSIIMATILCFMSLGYYRGSVITFKNNLIRSSFTKDAILITLVMCFTNALSVLMLFFFALTQLSIISPIIQCVLFSLIFLSFPAYLIGKISALIGRYLHHDNSNYTGRFMAVDTLGSVAGSLVTTLFLMPLIGVRCTSLFLIALTCLIGILLSRKIAILPFGFLFILGFCLNNLDPFDDKNIQVIKEDAISTINIIQMDFDENHQPQSKLLQINSSSSSKVSRNPEFEFKYVQFIENNLIKNMKSDTPKNILILGAGGFTLGKDDTFNNYTYIDIDKNLKEISERYFLEKPLTNNKYFVAQDGYQYLLNDKKKYDLIVLDIYSSRLSIPMNFITIEFLNLIKHHLTKNGIMAANIITSPTFNNNFAKNIDNTLRHVFQQNLSRQIIGNFNPTQQNLSNIIYLWFNSDFSNTIYTMDKNSSFYDQ